MTAASPSYSVFTPRESVRSPTPETSIYSSLLQSPTWSLNFQSLSIIDEQPDHEGMIIEDAPSSLDRSPTETSTLETRAPSEQPSNNLIAEDKMDEDFSQLALADERFQLKVTTGLLEDTSRFMNDLRSTYKDMLETTSIETAMEIEELHDPPKSIHQETRDTAQLFPLHDRLELEETYLSMMEIRRIYESTFELTNESSFKSTQFLQRTRELLLSSYLKNKIKVDAMREPIDPPPSPADAAPGEIEELAKRVAKFHGSVAVRYLEKTMERAKLRSYFAPDEQLEGRNIWYCVS